MVVFPNIGKSWVGKKTHAELKNEFLLVRFYIGPSGLKIIKWLPIVKGENEKTGIFIILSLMKNDALVIWLQKIIFKL